MFVDIDPRTRNIDLEKIDAAVTPATRALIPVDLAGCRSDRDRLYSISRRKNLRVIEDAAQSFGARWRGRALGTFGDLVAFSFHANKNITTAEGGALVLPDDQLISLCEKLPPAGRGALRRGRHGGPTSSAANSTSPTSPRASVSGSFLTCRNYGQKARACQTLLRALGRAPRVRAAARDFENSNWHMFQVVLPKRADRARFIAAMRDPGIGVGVHYPAMHLFALYRALAGAQASSRMPSGSAARSCRCRCSPR